jgi:SAM-dependent methyltransferase
VRYLKGDRENEIALRFDALLGDFMSSAVDILPKEELEAFTSYGFPGKDKVRLPREQWDRYLRSTMRGEEWLIQYILRNSCEIFVELGCGLGTWTFLAALSGAKTAIGIDLNIPRLNAARILTEKVFPRHGNADIRFINRSIFNVTFQGPIDVFYMKASIHHILPVDKLFTFMYEKLKPGGVVVIHDPNAAHLYSLLKALKDRGFRKRHTAKDPETGHDIPYAAEDIFTIPGIIWRAKSHGFRIIYKQAYLGFRGRANDWWYYNVIAPLNSSLALGTLLAPTYQIVLQRAPDHSHRKVS